VKYKAPEPKTETVNVLVHEVVPQEASEPVSDRKQGKSANPAYTKLTAYIRKDTHHAVKLRLLQEGQGREFSELVESLLTGWLKSK
jgi:hypothetical protein